MHRDDDANRRARGIFRLEADEVCVVEFVGPRVGQSLTWYDEVASHLLAWLTFYGAALASVKRAHIGCPVWGDPVYGKDRARKKIVGADGVPPPELGRQALHAAVLGFVHPVTGEELRFETEPPEDMATLIEWLRGL